MQVKRVLLVVAAALLVGIAAPGVSRALVGGGPPPPGALRGIALVLAWTPQSVRDVYADAGYVFAQQGPYVMFKARAWYDPDSGAVGVPGMPDGVEVLRIRKASATCTDPTICNDGGTAFDPVSEVQLDCACSSGAQCFIANPDGGLYPDGGPQAFPMPQGQTFDAFKGAGCVRKSCADLWVDGGNDWPDTCPCPSDVALPDGGVVRGC